MEAAALQEPAATPFGAALFTRQVSHGARDANQIWEGRKQLLEAGAYLFIWIIGLLAVIRLLTDYSAAIKPLLLAAVFVSILEFLVQVQEFVLWKLCVLLIMCVRKASLLLQLLLLGSIHCLRATFGRRCCPPQKAVWSSEEAQALIVDIKDWRRLFLKWDGLFAGKNTIFRSISVVGTLLLVGFFFFMLYGGLVASVTDFLRSDRLQFYSHQLRSLVNDTKQELDRMPDRMTFLDNRTRAQMRTSINQFEQNFDLSASGTFAARASREIEGSLNGVLSSSTDLLTQMVFFFLYTFLWLFDPLKITLARESALKKEIDDIFSVFSAWKREASAYYRQQNCERAAPMLGGDATPMHRARPLPQIGDKFYKRVKLDPRVGVHKKVNDIIQVYFSLKVLSNAIFAFGMWALLSSLRTDLSILMAMFSFFLAFIPELGLLVSLLLPVPIIVLDTTDRQIMGYNLVAYFIGAAAIKLVVGNIFESNMMGRNRTLNGAGLACGSAEEISETHPVIVLFVVVFAGEIWGPVGMLLAVPAISFIRLVFAFWFLAPHKPLPADDASMRFNVV